MNNKIGTRAAQINAGIASLRMNEMHIVYLVTEERNILKNLMPELISFTGEISGKNGQFVSNCLPKNRWSAMVKGQILADAYEVFELHKPYVKPEKIEGKSDIRKINPRTRFFLLQDFHLLDERIRGNFLKQFLAEAQRRADEDDDQYWVLFLVSPLLVIPRGLEYDMEIIDVPEMDRTEVEHHLWNSLEKENRGKTASDSKIAATAICQAAEDFCGLQRSEIDKILKKLKAMYGCFDDYWYSGTDQRNSCKVAGVRRTLTGEEKKAAALRDSTITIMDTDGNVAGMQGIVKWVREDVRDYFMDSADAAKLGIDPPKGVLVAGLPGTGKTQLAKQVAAEFGKKDGTAVRWVPLVQFRMDNLLGGLVGDSEANFKRCRKKIEALAPCVVLMDEIEKTFDTENSKNSNDVKMNILSALLDWMQENKKQIFFYATCNNIKLPPELQRDGRFTMRYSAFMPSESELVEIMAAHIRRTNDERHAAGQLIAVQKGKEEEQYRAIAKGFFTDITKYAKGRKEDRFYTGANIEALIQQTNIAMANMKKEKEPPYRVSDYQEELLAAAKSEKSQPYGMTNMRDIVKFWVSALDNQYVDVGEQLLFPFSEFDRQTGEFHFDGRPLRSGYDSYMRERISMEIEKYYKAQNQIKHSDRM